MAFGLKVWVRQYKLRATSPKPKYKTEDVRTGLTVTIPQAFVDRHEMVAGSKICCYIGEDECIFTTIRRDRYDIVFLRLYKTQHSGRGLSITIPPAFRDQQMLTTSDSVDCFISSDSLHYRKASVKEHAVG